MGPIFRFEVLLTVNFGRPLNACWKNEIIFCHHLVFLVFVGYCKTIDNYYNVLERTPREMTQYISEILGLFLTGVQI